jgi:hypothetical protein
MGIGYRKSGGERRAKIDSGGISAKAEAANK